MKTLKEYISNITEAKFKPSLDLSAGDEFYGIVCTMSERIGQSARNMKPVKFEAVDVKHITEKFYKCDIITVKKNSSNIVAIEVMTSDNWNDFWNAQGYIDDHSSPFYLFCAKSLKDLQKLMDSEVGDKIEDNLKEISKLAKDMSAIQEKINKLQEETQQMRKNSKLDV